MNALELLTGPMAQAIGWALLHLLWQATVVAGILAAVLALMSRSSANARYVVSCGALAMVFAMFLATAIRAYDPAAEPIAATTAGSAETIRVSLEQLPVLIAESAAIGLRDRLVRALAETRSALPTIVGIWLAGVILLSSRLLVSWTRARRLVRIGSQPATAEWQRVAVRLSTALGLHRAVTLLESAAVEVPSVIGSLRPIILLPASALTGLTPEQIEMVLAHELAHIKRHDFLVNLLQAVVETLMFFHPAVWWMSRRVRIERENCCDDLAVAVCGNPIQYARALTRLEELRASALTVMVAANGGSLLDRIRRIAAGRAEGTVSGSRWAAAVTMLSILLITVAIPSLPALAERKEKKEREAKAATAQVDAIVTPEPGDAADANDSDDDDAQGEPVDDIDPYVDSVAEGIADGIAEGVAPAVLAATDAFGPYTNAIPVNGVIAMPRLHLDINPNPNPVIAPQAMAHLAALDAARMTDPDIDDDDADERAGNREIGKGEKLTVDELISLRATGVTPEYLDAMREIFPSLRLREVTGMSAVGVTPQYIKDMRAAGFTIRTPREATNLRAVGVSVEYVREMKSAGLEFDTNAVTGMRAVGVTPAWVSEMRAAGFTIKTAREATNLKAVGVTAEYIRDMKSAGLEIDTSAITGMRSVGVTPAWVNEMRAAGFTIKTAREATNLKAVGVTAAYVRELRDAGFTIASASDATGMRSVGVTPEWVREMRDIGFTIQTAREATSLKAVGVTPEWVRGMKAAGITFTAKDATGLRALGVTPEFVRKLASAGYANLSVSELSRLAAAGVDDDFIRDMEQYRKKN